MTISNIMYDEQLTEYLRDLKRLEGIENGINFYDEDLIQEIATIKIYISELWNNLRTIEEGSK